MVQLRPRNYRCEVYLRTDTIGDFDAQQRVLDRIHALDERNGRFTGRKEAEWNGVETRECDSRDEMRATYEDFEAWADANGFSLKPAFAVGPRYIPGTTKLRDAILFPVVALAIYRDEELRAVLPSSDPVNHYTVEEALEGFERGDIDRWLARFSGVTVGRTAPHLTGAVEI